MQDVNADNGILLGRENWAPGHNGEGLGGSG